ncbi:phage holin family protein [Variovorax sp. J31P207]|uniref:phage holin family protein n=1 Tax=Variovorax sp. J31P207 TaxID=3053510 RepID=UPI0025771044|nr:phage holin family protein [Variovorax sp. J31P207]MDM0069077.1 phage holin family protein [Variovorax sp. J31P207]
MSLSALFGIKSRLRRLRILAGEGALAAGDRAQLLRLAWDEEKQRLRLMLGLGVAVAGLTTVVIALLSVAIVVHFWDTPYRATVAWVLALVWGGLWIAAVLLLMGTLRKSSAFDSARVTFERDLAWIHQRFGADQDEDDPHAPSLTSEQLLARIERQRARIATLEAAASGVGEAPGQPETASAAALRIAREHPIATGVATAAVIAVLGPRRLVRWATVIAPVLWRMRG